MDVHASRDVLDDNLHYQGSRIWFLATHSWVYVCSISGFISSDAKGAFSNSLPPYALALAIEQLIELVRTLTNLCELCHFFF